jgi:polyisoprenoid-binding protein YceI
MIKTSSSLATALALLASSLLACGGSTDAQAPAAAPTAASATPPTAPPAALAFSITPQSSKIEWTGAKVSTHHDGAFTSFKGQVDVPGAIEQGKVSIDIDTASLVVNDPALGPMADKLTGHLKSPAFFDAAKFPKATFTSTSIKAGGDKGSPYTVTGDLSIHGFKKEISFPATINLSADSVDASATFNINRKDFGMVLPGMPNDLIKDDVQVRLTVHAIKS